MSVSSEVSLPPKCVALSLTTMTEYVLPTHANAHGNVFGGQIMAWVDLCAAICAQRHTGRTAVTAGIDELSFEQAINVGQVVRLTARVTATFRTSVEVFVEVEGEESTSGERWPCVSAFVTFVAIDKDRNPVPVPSIDFQSEGELALAAAALERRKHRLAKRKRTS